MTHVTHPKLHVAPRRRTDILARPQEWARPAQRESRAAALTLATIVSATPLSAIAVAIAGALGA